MEEQNTVLYQTDLRIISQMDYYLRNKNIPNYMNKRGILLIAGGESKRIYIFTKTLENIGSFIGHKKSVDCLEILSSSKLASASKDKTIKIWNLEQRTIIFTLYEDISVVSALCCVSSRVLVSGSIDHSLIIWEISETYGEPKYILDGHISTIQGIIKLNNVEIISGEFRGDLRIWNIEFGTCMRHIPDMTGYGRLYQMKKLVKDNGVVAVCMDYGITVWGEEIYLHNALDIDIEELSPNKQFGTVTDGGCSVELLPGNILLRGGVSGELKFIDYTQTGDTPIEEPLLLHLREIRDIQNIAQNIVVTVSWDGSLKVIDPISRICYFTFKNKNEAAFRAISIFDE